MALSALALCARALLALGAQPISSLDDGTAEAEIAANLYPGTRDALLARHPWSFATGQTSLARLAAQPVADYRYAYALPPDFLRVLSAGYPLRGRGLDYRLLEQRLHSNAAEVTLTYLFRPDESAFPPHFAAALTLRLAAEFCIPLTENDDRAQQLFALAEAELRIAKSIDSQQAPPKAIENFPLIATRY
jgi:hypothetical protein